MKVVHLKIALGLGPCLRNNRKTLFPVSTFACFRGRDFLGILYSSPPVAKLRNKDAVRYRLNSDCCMTILLRQLWEELLPWERTRWHWSKHVKFRPSWLFHKGCLSLHSCQAAILPHRGSPLRPFPRVPLCPVNIPKITIVHVIACSLNLHISYYCSSVFWEYGQRLVEYGQAIDPQNLSLSGHPLLQEAWTLGLGTPPPPWKGITDFNIRCHHTSKAVRLILGAKSLAFCDGRHVAKKAQIISKASMHDCGMGIY